MAITKDMQIEDALGEIVTVQNAYIRIVTVTANKTDVNIGIVILSSDKAKNYNTKFYQMPYDVNTGISYTLCYEHLKTLPAYAGATDC